jgi:hypothetical protein
VTGRDLAIADCKAIAREARVSPSCAWRKINTNGGRGQKPVNAGDRS